jgi:hypothetical protein
LVGNFLNSEGKIVSSVDAQMTAQQFTMLTLERETRLMATNVLVACRLGQNSKPNSWMPKDSTHSASPFKTLFWMPDYVCTVRTALS